MPASNNSTYLTVPELFENNTVLAFSTRKGGCSEPPLSSLNFSTSQGDSQENVRENFRILTRALGVTPQGIVTCRQVHSDNVEVLSSVPPAPPVADALMTTKAGVFLGIKTADCLPVLLLDSNRGVAAAVHAGWRGTVLRLTRKVVRLMKTEFGSRNSDITAVLGPAIGACCYEVDDTVLSPFRQAIPDPERFIAVRDQPGPRKSHRLSLALVNQYELTAEGVPEENIRSVEFCTCCNPDLFFSHRRDGAATGRHIALVGFRA